MARHNVYLPDEYSEWLKAHPEVNMSRLFQAAVKAKMNKMSGYTDYKRGRNPGWIAEQIERAAKQLRV